MRTLFLIATTALLTGAAWADLPQKQPLSRYVNLWTNSPFTSKPPPSEGVAINNPLNDYVLGGVSPVGKGYRVTLLNRKNPEERLTVDSDRSSEYKILSVIRKSGEPLGTTVRISKGVHTATLVFDEKMLVLKAAAPTNQPAANPAGMPPGQTPANGQPPQPNTGMPPPRLPRPRVVPPPQTNPGAAPPAPQNIQRPNRR